MARIVRFTIRDVLWLTVVVGLAVGWWAEHRWVTHRSLAERFDYQATRWEAWCDRNQFRSDLRFYDHDSVDALVALGDQSIPLIFARWKDAEGIDGAPATPPWWKVLERITGRKMVTDQDKLDGVPAGLGLNADDLEHPALEEQRWRAWWEEEGKKRFGIDTP